MPRAPPPLPPDQHALRFTSFAPVGFLNAKNVASGFVKSESQSWFSRRPTEADRDQAREAKRRRLAGEESTSEDPAARATLASVLTAKPPSGVRQARRRPAQSEDDASPKDALDRTIVIHPGSRWLRLGLASQVAPVSVPNVIARKRPAGHQRAAELVPRPTPNNAINNSAAPSPTAPVPNSNGVHDPLRQQSNAETKDDEADWDSDDPGADPDAGSLADSDPLTAKITSLRGDLRARMRVYKLRGQGNGNSQAATFNASVNPEPMGEDFEGDFDWTTGEAEVWTGVNALRIPDPEGSNYELRWPFVRGDFDASGYASREELLGDVSKIIVNALQEELDIAEEELQDYAVILLIPDLYTLSYVRDMSDLLLRQLGFKQLAVVQESVCATFGAGVSSACVVDIGARTTKVACVEEGLVIPDTRMVLDFGGDDITAFLFTLLSRISFPYKEANLANWYDWIVIEDLKERIVVLSEGDITLSLNDFFVRRPGQLTQKYSLRVYDDCILAPYALFAPRVIDFEIKRGDSKPSPPNPSIEENVDIGEVRETLAMRNSVRHLLQAPPTTSSATQEPDPSRKTTPALPADGGAAANPLAGGAVLPALPAASVAGSPAPVDDSAPKAAYTARTVPPAIDVRYESSKLPLDVAVVESILAIVSGAPTSAAAEERVKKIATNLLIVGGTGGIHNIGFAVESRVAPALVARMPILNGVLGYYPCPREIEPEHLAWKGIAALGKLDSANELWVCKEEWEMLGMRALRERAFYWH
ncbi:hypothetical protein JCM10908_001851 [Rhodotorula pacifica]|uniref:Arp8p n=1 Tax=Rhodotorula pacifica TaxID=1495444 RepID=UPI00317C0816